MAEVTGTQCYSLNTAIEAELMVEQIVIFYQFWYSIQTKIHISGNSPVDVSKKNNLENCSLHINFLKYVNPAFLHSCGKSEQK